MALIENLERSDWQEFFRQMFDYTLDVLKNDRFRSVSSSVDDLRSWLARGGVSRVKEHLDNQMKQLRFPADKQADVLAFVDQLARENRHRLLALTSQGIIPATQQEWLAASGLTNIRFDDLLSRILAGERPFEDWMYAHGRSYEEIVEVYRVIDQWLMQHGVIPSPGALPPPRASVTPSATPETDH